MTATRWPGPSRVLSTVVVAAIAFIGAGSVPAHAQNCGTSRIVVYSQQAILEPVLAATGYFVPDANKDVWCVNAGDSDAPYDLRIINPGSTMVKVRFFGSHPGLLTLSGIINQSDIPMWYVPPAPPVQGGAFFDSPWIPLDPTRSGTLTATLNFTGSTVYHTVE